MHGSLLLDTVTILQSVGFVRLESCSTQAALPLVGLAADKLIRDRYNDPHGPKHATCLRLGRTDGVKNHKPW
ncbi:MAG: hypothetical protein ACQESR_22415 [Planctomycetota bacterium]